MSDALNFARAAIGQGLLMGWGDEAEAWLRSKVGNETYDRALKDVHNEYARFSKEHPVSSGVAEFAGGAAPGVAMMFVPGGQAAGAAQLQRSAASSLGRMAGLGAATGAVSGAGYSDQDRLGGAIGGGITGTAVGTTVPLAIKGVKSAKDWLLQRLVPTEKRIENVAAQKMNKALQEGNTTPQDIVPAMTADRALGVPSVVANVSPGSAKLAEAVAQRAGKGATAIEEKLTAQRVGARERVHQQVTKGLHPGDYYADEEKLINQLRNKAKTLYDDAYSFGEVNDPRITQVLDTPAFKSFFAKARNIADMEATAAKLRGEDPSKYALRDIYTPGPIDPVTGIQDMVLSKVPDVRTLDYIKRGIDASIESGFKGQGMSTAEASALRDLRRQFVTAIDENVPQYKTARAAYAGDMEVKDALNAGMNNFNKMDHEQVIRSVAGMTSAEKDAFRTGVARYLYSRVMDPSGNFNAAQRIIGSPEMQAKLQPLFDDPAQYNLFKNALEREAQLFHESNRILGGSQTSKREQMRGALEDTNTIGQAVGDAVTGGFWNSLTNAVGRTISGTNITGPVADKLATMLMSSEPHEVAAVVKLLEEGGKAAERGAAIQGAIEHGGVTGTTSAFWPSPTEEQ